MRRRRNYEDGVIVARHSLVSYDVLIPGRAWPWTRVGTLGPQNFEPGETVKIGFLKGNPQLPFIITEKPWPAYSGYIRKESIPDIAEWTHWAQGAGRASRSAWTSLDIRRLGIVSYLYGGASTRNLVRVVGSDIYVDWFGGYLVKFRYGATEDFVADWGGGVVKDMVVDTRFGSLFVLSGNTLYRLRLDDLTQLWSRSFTGATTASRSLFVAYGGVGGGVVGCLATAASAASGGQTLRMATWDIDTGAPVLAPTELYQEPIPPFPGDPLDVPYVSGSRAFQSQLGDKICQWLPDGEHPDYAEGTGDREGQKFHPFAGIDFVPYTGWIPAPVYPRDPQELVWSNALRWGFSGSSSDFSRPIVTPIDAVICAAVDVRDYPHDLIIPRVRFAPTLVGYAPSGAKALEVLGWGQGTGAGEREHLRKFFTPIMADRGKILVLARHCTFYDTRATVPYYGLDIEVVYDDTVRPPFWKYTKFTTTLEETKHFHGRVLIRVEDYLEVYDAAGGLISSAPCTATKITSMCHFPEGEPPPAPGGPYISSMNPFNDEDDGIPMYVKPDPEFEVTPENSYAQPWLFTHIFNFNLDDSLVEFDPGGKDATDTYGTGRAYIVNTGSKVLYVRPNTSQWGVPHWVECSTIETQEDVPLLFDWAKPVLSTDRSCIIFPPRRPSNSGYDGSGNMVLTSARRTWSGDWLRDFMEDVVLGDDWRKDRQWIYAFSWPTMMVAWRHQISYDINSTVIVGIPGCGSGKCYIPYRVGSQTRIRVLNDTTGALIEDFVPSGAQVGQVNENSQIILTGEVALLVTDDGVMGIYEP